MLHIMPHRITSLILLVIAGLCTGCTHTWEVDFDPYSGYPDAPKKSLDVGLVIDQDFKASEWVMRSMGDKWVTPLGDTLTENSTILAGELFRSVQLIEVDDAMAADANAIGVDALLIPRTINVSQTQPVFAFEDMQMVIEVEWVVKDRNGRIIFQDTVQGQGENRGGNVFTGRSRQNTRVELTVYDLFAKSYEALSSSPEIQEISE